MKEFLKKIKYEDNKILFEIENNFSKLIWEKLFNYLKIQCTYKSLNNLLEVLTNHKNNKKININKNTVITLHYLDITRIQVIIEKV